MKKIVIGAIVGGIIIFICQTLSWTVLDLHRPAAAYTPKEKEIMEFLNNQFSEDGGYFLPNYPPGASDDVIQQHMKEADGKPWAIISYHKKLEMSMGMNIFRNLIVDMVMVGLFCWIISRFAAPRFSTILIASLLTGLIVFINVPYTIHIWYQTFDLSASLIDAIVGWGLVGLWLGWWYGRKNNLA